MKEELKNILDFALLKKIYFFANTPQYLYKHFRGNESIFMLSNKYKLNELIKMVYDFIKRPEDVDGLICLYSLVIALSFKQDYKARLFIRSLSKFHDGWLTMLSKIILASSVATQNEEVNMKFEIKEISNSITKDSSSNFISVGV